MSSFWTHTIWYILLGISTLIVLIYVMVKSKHRRLNLAFFFTILGLNFFFEAPILVFWGAYNYYPMLVPAHLDPFFDSIVGNLFSQFSVAATAVLVAVFDLKYYWWFIFAGIYAFIEETFLVLGIYSQNWYQTWMTIILFPMLFWLTKYLYARIIQDPKPLLYYIYTFFALLPIAYYPTIWGFQVAQILDYNETLLANPEISQSIIRYLIFLVVAATMMCVYFLKVNRYWKAFITALLYAAFYMAFKLDLIFVKAGWFIPASTIIIVWMYLSVIILDKLYGGLSMRSGARSG